MANAVGPVFAGGFEEFVLNDEAGEEYTIAFLPDRNNDELQAERKQPVFYYLPEQVRLARKGDRGDFKFRHIHFVGVFDDTNVGIAAGETQGGVLSLTTTSRYPTSVLKQAEQQILQRFSGKSDKYWGLRTNVAPAIKIAPIVSNTTAISNISPAADGSIPGEGAVPGGGTPAPPAGGPAGGGEPIDEGPRSSRAIMRGGSLWQPVPHGRGFRAPLALDPWAWKMDGQGPGSITGGENAYAGLIGPIPSEIVWAGFHGAYSPLVVTQNLMLPMWSQLMRLKITGDWSRIFTHFSAHAQARYLWFSADIKAEFNNLRINGGIKVEMDIDGTMPGGQDLEKAINQRIDLIVAQFTEQAKKVIFDPPQPSVPPAQAPSGGFFSSLFGGAGLALKVRHDSTQLKLSYEETRYFRYLQPHTISSSLEGFYNEIKQDPKAEQKYFMRLVLGDLGRKVKRLVKPVVNWPDQSKSWAGEPVAFLSAQIGYPGPQGQIQWKAQTFQKSDPADSTFRPVFVERQKSEVTPPPAGWEPDQTFVKRKIHLLEAPGENAYPFIKAYVEQNIVDLDPGVNGTLTNDNILEVRADEAGTLDVGPMGLAAILNSSAEVVEVEVRAKGRRLDGTDRSTKSSRFRWTFADQDEPRYWRIFTGDLNYAPAYQYRVHVTVRGTIFAAGQAWSGPWVEGVGNGALMIDIPGPDAAGVVKRALTTREMFSDVMVRVADSIPTQPGVTEPGSPPPAPTDGLAPTAPTAGGGSPEPLEAPHSAAPGNISAPRSFDDVILPPPIPDAHLNNRSSKDTNRSVQGYDIAPEEPGATSSKKKTTARATGRRQASAGSADEEGPGWVTAPPTGTADDLLVPSEPGPSRGRKSREMPSSAEWEEAPVGTPRR